MKNIVLLTLMLIFVGTAGLSSSKAQFPIKIPKIPKINKEQPSAPDTSSTSDEITSSDRSSDPLSSDSEDRGKAIPGAKLAFSTSPFASGEAATKTNFRSSDFIYARVGLGGRSVYDAFGMKSMGVREFYYLYISMSVSKDRIKWQSH